MPFPSNENLTIPRRTLATKATDYPWKKLSPGEPPAMTLQLIFGDGRVISYASSDIREMQKRDPGHLQIFVYGMEKYRITIEGRHLDDLFDLLQNSRVRSLTEMGPRTFDHPEDAPSIEKITVEALTGPQL
ncbi:hypothetical protein [Planctomycetes bacterium TBK1r]